MQAVPPNLLVQKSFATAINLLLLISLESDSIKVLELNLPKFRITFIETDCVNPNCFFNFSKKQLNIPTGGIEAEA